MGKDLCHALGKETTVIYLTALLSYFWHPCLLSAKEKSSKLHPVTALCFPKLS